MLLFLILQICLHVFRLHRRPGLLSAIFFLGYGTFRFICEFFREPDAPFLGPVSMGMALSIPVWLTAGGVVRDRLAPKPAKARMTALGAAHRRPDRGAGPHLHRPIYGPGAA